MNHSDLLRSMMTPDVEDDAPRRPRLPPDLAALRLREARRAYAEPSDLRVGDVVRQKPRASYGRVTSDHGLAIVVEVRDPPVEISSTVERLDLVLGYVDEDEDLALAVVSSARWERVSDEVLAELTAAWNKPDEDDEDER